jgi:ABC-2 type transport system permease protein
VSHISPATYLLRGIRDALLNGATVSHEAGLIGILALFGVVLVPASLVTFGVAERWAKKTGRLKRQG